jgi:hypothetical protein
MRTFWTLLLMSIGTFMAAFVARRILVPDVAPIATVTEPQALWAVLLAFFLRAIENISAIGAALVVVGSLVQWIARRAVSQS